MKRRRKSEPCNPPCFNQVLTPCFSKKRAVCLEVFQFFPHHETDPQHDGMCPLPLAHGSKLPSRGPSAPHGLNNSQHHGGLENFGESWQLGILATHWKVRISGRKYPNPKPRVPKQCTKLLKKHSLSQHLP